MGDGLSIEGLLVQPLKIISHPKGDVYKAFDSASPQYHGFGEVYFSTISNGAVKGWKRHNRFSLNLVVPVGQIHFVIYDDRRDSETAGQYNEITLGMGVPRNYSRLTIPKGLWVAFKGLEPFNLLMNIIPDIHDPFEADNLDLNGIPFSF